eukprot:TRINITY_DN1581_c0_g3_i2.p1 TRINITY_DN1581_c0_g3~~TRINITY_DN1581_c0_g3_i2.p1  ORF type:complete len:200 (-),score=78.67 TRINITY_DN1581_c0_g3_i2:400-999(-)
MMIRFANKQDLTGAVDAVELTEHLKLDEIPNIGSFHIEGCIAKTEAGNEVDERIGEGLKVLMDSIESEWKTLKKRTTEDVHQREIHRTEERARKKAEREKRREQRRLQREKEEAEKEEARALAQTEDNGDEITVTSSSKGIEEEADKPPVAKKGGFMSSPLKKEPVDKPIVVEANDDARVKEETVKEETVEMEEMGNTA